ncbi:MAG: MFS transporter [Thermodesulfobacteriota bacterium]|nr:MFS transporter [Thermodesulfobacteriota bacterium]
MEERYRWNILALIYLSMLAFAFVFQSIPPVLSLIIHDFQISHTQAGLLMTLFALPGIFLSIPGGILFDLFGTKKIAVSCFVLMIVGVLVVIFGRTFLHLAIGRTVSGVGALVLAIGLPRFLIQWFSGKELGIAMGIFNTAIPLGSIISFSLLGRLGKGLGWHTSVSLSGIVTFIALIAFLLFFKHPPSLNNASLREFNFQLPNFRETGISIWLLAMAWMWFNASLISLSTFAPDFFMEHRGFSIGFAGFLTSFIMWGSLLFSPAVGYIIDKWGFKEILIAISGLILGVVIFLIPYVPGFLIFFMVLIGLSVALVPAPVFSLPSDLLEPENLGFGFGIISTCLSVGMVFGPYFVGLIREQTGSYEMSFIAMAGFALFVTITILSLFFITPSKR